MIKKISLLVTLLALYVILLAYSYSNTLSNNLSEKVFRLHIIANSNSIEDQNLKYKIRDEIINYMNTVCLNSSSKEETIEIMKNHLTDLTEITNSIIVTNGYNYTASSEIGTFSFPTKKYGDITFPAGNYDALEIKIGKAQGQNWWCVLYPSLCFIDETSSNFSTESKSYLENVLSNESYQIITNTQSSSYKIKFKIIELFSQN